MASESTCDMPGPLGTGAIVGNRPTKATCAYHAGHYGPCSWTHNKIWYMRPNGKTYHPRKRPKAFAVDGDYQDYVLVLRTWDVAVAYLLAEQFAQREIGQPVNPRPMYLGWMRLAMRDGELQWITDEIRGVPAIYFAVT